MFLIRFRYFSWDILSSIQKIFNMCLLNLFCTRVQFCGLVNSSKWQNFRLVQIEGICKWQINMTEKLKFVFGRVENKMVKVENAHYQHFLLFPQCFQKASYIGLLKVWIVLEREKRKLFIFVWYSCYFQFVHYFTVLTLYFIFIW